MKVLRRLKFKRGVLSSRTGKQRRNIHINKRHRAQRSSSAPRHPRQKLRSSRQTRQLRHVRTTNNLAQSLSLVTKTASTQKSAAAVVMCMNEEKNMSALLSELKQLELQEIIIVVNGSTDQSFDIVRANSDAHIVYFSDPVGHDVGRAIGAKLTNAEIVLVIDGDIAVTAVQLAPFIQAVNEGMDIALNDIRPYVGLFHTWDSVTRLKHFLNMCYNRSDLGCNSLTAIPHALSRKAIETLGASSLMLPPHAMALAMESSLQIGAPVSIDVIRNNRIRPNNTGANNDLEQLIIGDHLEAIHFAIHRSGKRLKFADHLRNRSLVGGI